MDMFGAIYRGVDHLSATQTAAAGSAGASVTIATALLIDVAALASWLQIATLALGLVTGLGSLALVLMKLVQQRRDMRRR
jgi:hypothetical protein